MIEKKELVKKKLVIFDLDGTLVDTLEDVVTSLNEALTVYNYQGVTKDYVKGYLGYGGNTLVSSILKFEEKHLVNEINNIYLEKYQKNLLNNTVLYPGVQNTLDYLENLDIKMAICTNKKSKFTWEIIEELKIEKYFEIVVSGDTLVDKKPSGIPLSYIFNKLSIEKVNTVMVGDTEIDYKSAISADIEFIYANYGYGEILKSLNKVNNFKELLNYFK